MSSDETFPARRRIMPCRAEPTLVPPARRRMPCPVDAPLAPPQRRRVIRPPVAEQAAIAVRRRGVQRTDSEWEELVIGCLTGLYGKWGCLNKTGVLFRMCTFSSIAVPRRVIENLLSSGNLYVNNDGFYVYVKRTITKRCFKKA